jgi:uncharacterized damage-inducible protein DinB
MASNLAVLQQAVDLVERLDDHAFTQLNPALALSSVGSHLRHCLDFYQCLLSGLVLGRINYDDRQRDAQVEQHRHLALIRLKAVIQGLGQLPQNVETHTVKVCLEGGLDSEQSPSTIKRELQFLLSHTVHHYALIALALRTQGLDPGAEFGVAPSTLQHWRKAA